MKEITGNSRRKWSSVPQRLRHKDAVPAQPYFKGIMLEETLGEVWGGDSPSSGIPVLGRVILHGSSPFLQCQTLQREFEQTSRAQAWQRGQGGRGDSTVRACCKVSHSGSGVPCAGGALSGCQLSLHEVHNKLCPPKRSDCTAQQPLTSWGLSQTHWWVVTALPWLSEAAVSLK